VRRIRCCGSGRKRRQGTPGEKLVLFERLKTAGAFVHESAAELAEAEKTLRMFASMEKKVFGEAS